MLVLKPVAQVEKSTCLTAGRKLWQLDFCSNAFVNLHPNRWLSFPSLNLMQFVKGATI